MGTNTSTSTITTDFSSQNYNQTPQYNDTSLILDSYSVSAKETDGATGQGEITYTPNWAKWHGYYRTIPEFQGVIDKLASWTFGRGIKADKKNEEKMKGITGFGKDTFRGIAKNQWRTALICGDSFAEIIKDKQGRIINLKPLNPGSIKIVENNKGILIRYEQTCNLPNSKPIIFTPDEIFHLSYERIADEMHGIPFAEKLEQLILMRNEAMLDLKVLYHRNIKPINWIEVETDNTADLNFVQSKINDAYKKTENIVIPAGVIGEIKRLGTPQYSTLDSLPWLKFLVRQFVTACGMPEVIMGWGEDTTEASSKIIYLAFQQTIEDMQIYNEEQYEEQINIIMELEFPASLEDELLADEKKDTPLNKERKSELKPK